MRRLFLESCYINIPSVECFDLLVKAYKQFLPGEQFTRWIPTDNIKIGLWRCDNLDEYWENLIEVKAENDMYLCESNGYVCTKYIKRWLEGEVEK